MQNIINNSDLNTTQNKLNKACKTIAPLYSLENFVAVNPYLGFSHMDFTEAMRYLGKTNNIKASLPLAFYLKAYEEGRMSKVDLSQALEKRKTLYGGTVEEFLIEIELVNRQEAIEEKIKTFADVADELNGKKWSRFMEDRISFWASAYFDKHQAIWDTSPDSSDIFESWKKEAEVDYSTDLMGLKGFKNYVKNLPDNHLEAAEHALKDLELNEDVSGLYLTALLFKMNGWAGITSRIDWDANLNGQVSNATEQFLAILLVWEIALKQMLNYPNKEQSWRIAKQEAYILKHTENHNKRLNLSLIFQEAFDIANQRSIVQKINEQSKVEVKKVSSSVQAIFCIDVRSELYRRHLEATDECIETMGFAGFFAFPIKYIPLAHESGASNCPVLLTTTHTIKESIKDSVTEGKAITKRTLKEHVSHAWKSFKLGAVTCFSFVGPVGLAYLPKLFTDSFGLSKPVTHPNDKGLSTKQIEEKGIRLDQENLAGEITGISINERVEMAKAALGAMSLTDNFARVVLITGHGSSTINNPHATGLDCGACGGNTGEANAKVAAAVLNDTNVRKALIEQNINIPDETIFVAALHDTTTDEVKLFASSEKIKTTHNKDIEELKQNLSQAAKTAREERAERMNINDGDKSSKVLTRSNDWSQVRPEWGLAGCSSFIVAPRHRTKQLDFGGKAFMHSYNWESDKGFGVLELIMTAPMVVTSWINLQYYASTVDNKTFGSGNKTLHNVVGGLGVLEGFTGDLRTGLPWQSVHDGEKFQHEPQRLNVIIEAPVDEMSKILNKHDGIKQLCDNEWIYLFAMNSEGKVAYKYIGDLEWEVVK